MYNFGGDLIYHNLPVFVDGRADLYSKNNYGDYLSISMLHEGAENIIYKYNFDYFIVDSTFPINIYLRNNDDYELVYENRHDSIDVLVYKNVNYPV